MRIPFLTSVVCMIGSGWFLLAPPVVTSYSVIIVPGFGGSVLQDRERGVQVWPPYPSLKTSKALDITCFENDTIRCQSVLPLVTLPLGDTRGIDIGTAFSYLLTKNTFYRPLIKKLEKQNATVSAFSYDFRMMFPHSDYLHTYCQQMKTYMETSMSNHRSHIVICHSLGGLIFHFFLTHYTTPSWQKQYISRVYFLNVPFGGCQDALYTILKNEREVPFQIPFHNFVIESFHYFAGLYWCLPLCEPSRPILRVGQHWYVPRHIHHIFKTLHMPISLGIYKDFEMIYRTRKEPIHIPTFIIYGSHLNTTCFIDWDTKTSLYEDGDGVVTRSSLLYPKQFMNPNHTYYIEVKGMEHGRVTDCLTLFDYLVHNNLPTKDMTLHVDQSK